jgi:DNA modification methylase
LDIERIDASKLKAAKYNPRKNLKPGDPEYEKLKRSITEFGYVEPVIWNQRTGNIVGGHQRFKVLTEMGQKQVDCVVVDLDVEREKALNIALNKVSGDWDLPLLTDLLNDLEDSGFDVSLTGFDAAEIDALFDSKASLDSDEVEDDNFDADEALAKIDTPISQSGDVWLLGNHRLMCGDSTSLEDIAVLMDGKKARHVFTDPPWNVNYGADMKHPSWKPRQIMNDSMSTEDFKDFMTKVFKVMAQASEPGCMTYVVMSAQEWGNLMLSLKESGYHWSSTIIWAKDTLVLSRKDYHTQYEPLWYGWLDGGSRLCPLDDRKQSDVWQIARPKRSDAHPTMKPIELVARTITNSSRKGDLVLDLFGGSGSTLIAAEQTNRVCHMMELDPKYADVIVNRFISNTGTDSGVFLLRDGEKILYASLPNGDGLD